MAGWRNGSKPNWPPGSGPRPPAWLWPAARRRCICAFWAAGPAQATRSSRPPTVCRSVFEAVAATGATPVLCDVGEAGVLGAATVAPCLTPRTKAIVAPHVCGIFADVAPLKQLGPVVIEDFAQAVAAKDAYRLVGDYGMFSLQPTKCLTAGEGGVAVAATARNAEILRSLRDGGPTLSGPARRLVFAPLSDLAASLALSQLERYASCLTRRKELALGYKNVLDAVAPELLAGFPWTRSMFFRLPVRVREGF